MSRMPTPEVLTTLGVIAIELAGEAPVGRNALPQAEAGDWAAGIAADLARVVAEAASLDLVVAAALYDPSEILRPNVPRHALLESYAARVPGEAGGRVIAFGAGTDGLPADLAPQTDLAGGPLRVLPFLLRGPAEAVKRVGEALEERLLDTGMANAGTALATQSAFGLRVEHMRYLTLHDLMAMMAMQYEHAGLAGLWPMIEAALFGDDEELWLDAPPEPLVRYANGAAQIALIDADAWALGGFVPPGVDAGKLGAEGMERLFDHFEARQRQIAAVLGAHGLEVTFAHCPVGKDARAILRG
ncbi:hypothetical protein [Silanimonas sp.]|uniref:hypothetical protein n=1 Tax=Silanimonas sp. TaxID=1929290 RepID=UPI0026126415|nr:hypothetical protein [Silanimonas sp.]